MLLLYNLISTLVLIIYLPVVFIKGINRGGTRYIKERLGIARYQKTDIWVHAVSLGETIACIPLLKRLKKAYPQKRITISTTTHTGQRVAMERFPEAERIIYMPWDASLSMKGVVDSLMPSMFITVETELWPMLFHHLKEVGTTTIILNGRLSNNSFKRYRMIRYFMKGVLSNIDYLYMQSLEDADRIISLGAKREDVMVMNNLKFDIEMDITEPPVWRKNLKEMSIIAGSTHRGEEEIILNVYSLIKKEFDDLTLILAPRHPERFDEVETMIKRLDVDYSRRTELSEDRRYDVILLDTIGELSQAFSLATIAFVGGSLVPYGGHNILEPAYWGKPIIFGPFMDNFPFAKDFIEQSAATMVRNPEELSEGIRELLINHEKARIMGEKARSIIDKNRGATERALRLIKDVIDAT